MTEARTNETSSPVTVSEITFVVVVDGERRASKFLRQEKIIELLSADSETLGSWLRSLTEQEVLPEEDRFTPGKLPCHYLESEQHTFCKVEGDSLDKIGRGDPDDVFLASSLADVTCLDCLRIAVAQGQPRKT